MSHCVRLCGLAFAPSPHLTEKRRSAVEVDRKKAQVSSLVACKLLLSNSGAAAHTAQNAVVARRHRVFKFVLRGHF